MINKVVKVMTILQMFFVCTGNATPIIFKENFEPPVGSIEFIGQDSALLTEAGDSAGFHVIVKDHQDNVINDGDVQWSLSASDHVILTTELSRYVEVLSDTFQVGTVELTVYHPGVNASATAHIIMAELATKTHLIEDSDVISGQSPIVDEQTVVHLRKNSRTNNIQTGDYVLAGVNTGLMIKADQINTTASEHIVTASATSLAEVYENLQINNVSKSKTYTAKVSASDKILRIYDKSTGLLAQKTNFIDSFQCEDSLGSPVGFELSGADIAFDFTLGLDVNIDVSFLSVNEFSVIGWSEAIVGATTGGITFDSEVAAGVVCKVTLNDLNTSPFFIHGFSFQLAITPIFGYEFGGSLSGPSMSFTGPTGIIERTTSTGVKYTGSNGWEFVKTNDFNYEFDLLSGEFDGSFSFEAFAEVFAQADLRLKVNLGIPPLGVNLANVKFMEVKASERLTVGMSSPFDPENINYTGPMANLTGNVTIAPDLDISESGFLALTERVGINLEFNLTVEPLLDLDFPHWQSPSPSLILPAQVQAGTVFQITVNTQSNRHNGTFSIVSDSLNTLNGSLQNGTGSATWQPQSSDLGTHNLYPRVEIDSLSRFLPYAGNPASVIVTNTPVQNDLVAYFPLDGNANDLSGFDNHGTEFGGLVYENGVQGLSAKFDGINDYISTQPYSDTWNEWTFSLFVRLEDFNNHYMLIERERIGSYNDFDFYVQESTGLLYSESDNADDSNTISINPINLGEWNHVAATYDGNSKKIYINGSLDVSEPVQNALIDVVEPLLIGKHANSSHPLHLKGNLDEIRVYNRALSLSEIQAIANNP